MKYTKYIAILALLILNIGCFKDLNTTPLDPTEVTNEVVLSDPSSYEKILAKLYAGFAVSGQEGPSGRPDISGIDEGFGQYLRGYWYHQELTTDEAVIGWADQTILDFHGQSWTSQDGFIFAFYSRIFYQVSLCNEFIRETTEEKLDSRGITGAVRNNIPRYRAEARFLRSISYWHALDLFRNPPFVTENESVGSFFPDQTNPAALFAYIESELKAIEPAMADPRQNQYARADKAAVWMLLAKLYLNAEVYVGQNRYADCLEYCEKLLTAGYNLEPNYRNLFLTDNHNSREIIFPVAFDGVRTRTWGGMTFIIAASIGGSINAASVGMNGGWGGTRTTPEFVAKFPQDLTGVLVDFNPGGTKDYSKVYVPGSYQGFNGGESDNSISAKVKDVPIYEGFRYFPENNTEFVFLRNPSGMLSGKIGSNNQDGTLQSNGANIVAGQSGLYYLKADLRAPNLRYELDRKTAVISGSATGGSEIEFTWNPDLTYGRMIINTELNAGSYLITIKGSTGNIVLGDTGQDGLLEENGAPIQVVNSGGHKITLDLKQHDYTYKMELTSFDRRGIFHTAGQQLSIDTIASFNNGYAVQKFKNISSTGVPGKDVQFPDTDFPMFRLADVYLMAAEAILRGAGGGDKNRAADYVNAVRQRAYTGSAGNISPAELTLDFILDERARELYWECHRRTDLIRFGKFSNTNYLWQWKGNVKEGRSTEAFRDVFPIPAADLNANPNLRQNNGY